jgi:hypothetical protein
MIIFRLLVDSERPYCVRLALGASMPWQDGVTVAED